MADDKMYGQLKSEKLVEEAQVARQIVKEINNFQITDRQRWLIIHALALEVEDIEKMRELVACINELNGSELFLTKIYENPEGN
jgi:hypothetical protein